jgi:hypothetical protein
MEKIRIRDPGWKKDGSEINIPDPHHCYAADSRPTAGPDQAPVLSIFMHNKRIICYFSSKHCQKKIVGLVREMGG